MSEVSERDLGSSTYMTEPNQYNSVPTRLKDLCGEMEQTVQRASVKFSGCLDAQRLRFFKAFKNVVEQVLEEFSDLQKKFEEYISFCEHESQNVAIQNKLVFFRNECQAQQKLCQQYKRENHQLKLQLDELRNENTSQYNVMIKQMNDKILLQQKMEDISKTNISGDSNKKGHQNFITTASTFQRPKLDESRLFTKQLTTTHQQISSPRTVYVYKDEQNELIELRELWKECVAQTKQLIRQSPTERVQALVKFLKCHHTLEQIIFHGGKCCSHPECPMNMHQDLHMSQSSHTETTNPGGLSFINQKITNILGHTRSQESRGRRSRSYELRKYRTNYANVSIDDPQPKLQNLVNLYQIELSNLKSQEKELANTRVIIEQIRLKKSISEIQDKLRRINKNIQFANEP